MNDLISRGKLISKFSKWLDELKAEENKGYASELYETRGSIEAIESAIVEIEAIPSADVQPVERGEWECVNDDDNVWMCSHCGGEVSYDVGSPMKFEYNYCMYCGARMDGANITVESNSTVNEISKAKKKSGYKKQVVYSDECEAVKLDHQCTECHHLCLDSDKYCSNCGIQFEEESR